MKILFSPPLHPRIVQMLKDMLPKDCELTVARPGTPDFTAGLASAEVLIGMPPAKADEQFFSAAPRLKLIHLVSAGFEGIDVSAARKAGVFVCNNGSSNADAVAEHTLALMFAAMKNLVFHHQNVIQGKWRVGTIATQWNLLCKGKTIGFIGFGQIGRRVANVCRALGMQIVYHDPFLKPEAVIEGARSASLDSVLESGDVVSLHLPLSEKTEGMIGAAELARMKPEAILINTARGRILDENALFEALSQKKLGFAALDVMMDEPPAPDHRLFGLSNVIITPHIAAVSMECWPEVFRGFIENLERLKSGTPPQGLVFSGQ